MYTEKSMQGAPRLLLHNCTTTLCVPLLIASPARSQTRPTRYIQQCVLAIVYWPRLRPEALAQVDPPSPSVGCVLYIRASMYNVSLSPVSSPCRTPVYTTPSMLIARRFEHRRSTSHFLLAYVLPYNATLLLFYYSWNGGRAGAVCAGENESECYMNRGGGRRRRGSLIAEFYLVDRGLRHRLPGFSSLGRLVILP